jgi:hypothetical protein
MLNIPHAQSRQDVFQNKVLITNSLDDCRGAEAGPNTRQRSAGPGIQV